jgi:hypothetical protein
MADILIKVKSVEGKEKVLSILDDILSQTLIIKEASEKLKALYDELEKNDFKMLYTLEQSEQTRDNSTLLE